MPGGDLVAIEAKYHLACLVKYRNRCRSFKRQHVNQRDVTTNLAKARAFAELTSHMEVSVEEGYYLFKLAEVHRLYQERLSNLGHDTSVNKTRPKEKLLHHFAQLGLQAQSDGKNTILIFPEGMQQMLKDAFLVRDYDEEVLMFAKVAKICRRITFRRK